MVTQAGQRRLAGETAKISDGFAEASAPGNQCTAERTPGICSDQIPDGLIRFQIRLVLARRAPKTLAVKAAGARVNAISEREFYLAEVVAMFEDVVAPVRFTIFGSGYPKPGNNSLGHNR